MSHGVSKHKLLCIVCPESCEMEICEKEGELIFPKEICGRGQDYARQEINNPSRVLTTTVPILSGEIAVLPVRTFRPIPKSKLIEALQQIASIEVNASVKVGDIICRDLVGTGVPLIACRTIN